ncbi:MAG: hypothetical protein ACT4QD_11455 [Acidobacteriota bacterium]
MEHDKVLNGFLTQQLAEGTELAASSDLLRLTPCDGPLPRHYLAEFRCKGLVQLATGEIAERDHFVIGVSFPSDYLRRAHPAEVLTLLGPQTVFHPNVRGSAICVGRLKPGTRLVDLLYQCFEILTYVKVTMREDDALNREACAWARSHDDRFPIDRRPLKRRAIAIQVDGTS